MTDAHVDLLDVVWKWLQKMDQRKLKEDPQKWKLTALIDHRPHAILVDAFHEADYVDIEPHGEQWLAVRRYLCGHCLQFWNENAIAYPKRHHFPMELATHLSPCDPQLFDKLESLITQWYELWQTTP